MDFRTEPKPEKGLRSILELEETECVIGVGCLLGAKGRRERSERSVGIPVGAAGDGKKATEEFEPFEMEGRRTKGMEDGKALGLGSTGVEVDIVL